MNILEYENYQEKISHGSPTFPYNTYLCSIPLDFSHVPVHWHDEMEIIYIKKGKGIISVDFNAQEVNAGTLVLILPGQLHAIEQYEAYSMEYENIIFHPDILISKKTDACNHSFLLPLLAGKISLPTFYNPGDACYNEIIACMDANDEISKTNPTGYQLFIKSHLFLFFYVLFNKCEKTEPVKRNYQSLEKMKLILKYIENNYMNKITIEEIAEEVHLSQSHFMKYFKNTMGTSFINYLNEYRLTMASRLLTVSDSTILDIAAEVGFDNLSYFNRAFKKRFGQTPSAYRKRSV